MSKRAFRGKPRPADPDDPGRRQPAGRDDAAALLARDIDELLDGAENSEGALPLQLDSPPAARPELSDDEPWPWCTLDDEIMGAPAMPSDFDEEE
ncbi:MAG: hypothetical protein ACOX6T_10625 [Myxococcales bacterium]|jgi:hypothetical protein